MQRTRRGVDAANTFDPVRTERVECPAALGWPVNPAQTSAIVPQISAHR
ncbi:hypothetical protein ACIRQQ_34765 [Streptomyces fuscichromogenes]